MGHSTQIRAVPGGGYELHDKLDSIEPVSMVEALDAAAGGTLDIGHLFFRVIEDEVEDAGWRSALRRAHQLHADGETRAALAVLDDEAALADASRPVWPVPRADLVQLVTRVDLEVRT